MLPAFAIVLVLAVLAQVLTWHGMGRRQPIGDEVEYLERGRSRDPHAPERFLRPPTLPWLAKVCHRQPARGEIRCRLVFAVMSCFTIALTAIAGWLADGPGVGLLAAVLLTAQPERLLLANHIWPETLLAATLAALAIVHTLPATPATSLAAGLVAALGVSIRIDFVAALPLLLLAWTGSWSVTTVATLLAPSLLLLAALSIRNHRRYGIALPDTTWAFNLLAARSEAYHAGKFGALGKTDGPPGIEHSIADALATWERLPPAQRSRHGMAALWQSLRSPWRFFCGVLRHLLTLIGPDTFIRQKLLPRDAAYPDLGDAARRNWDQLLRFSLPALIAVTFSLMIVGQQRLPHYAWPTLGLVIVAVLFHARTRNRVAFLPILVLVASQQIWRSVWAVAEHPESATLWAAGLATFIALLIFAALIRIRCSIEL